VERYQVVSGSKGELASNFTGNFSDKYTNKTKNDDPIYSLLERYYFSKKK